MNLLKTLCKTIENQNIIKAMIKDVEMFAVGASACRYYTGDTKLELIKQVKEGKFESEVELIVYLIKNYNIQYKDCKNILLRLYKDYPMILNYISDIDWKMAHSLMEDYFKPKRKSKNEYHMPSLKVPTLEFEMEKTGSYLPCDL